MCARFICCFRDAVPAPLTTATTAAATTAAATTTATTTTLPLAGASPAGAAATPAPAGAAGGAQGRQGEQAAGAGEQSGWVAAAAASGARGHQVHQPGQRRRVAAGTGERPRHLGLEPQGPGLAAARVLAVLACAFGSAMVPCVRAWVRGCLGGQQTSPCRRRLLQKAPREASH